MDKEGKGEERKYPAPHGAIFCRNTQVAAGAMVLSRYEKSRGDVRSTRKRRPFVRADSAAGRRTSAPGPVSDDMAAAPANCCTGTE